MLSILPTKPIVACSLSLRLKVAWEPKRFLKKGKNKMITLDFSPAQNCLDFRAFQMPELMLSPYSDPFSYKVGHHFLFLPGEFVLSKLCYQEYITKCPLQR